MGQYILKVIYRSIAGGFRANEGPAVGETLTGDDAVFKRASQPAVLAVQVPNLPGTHAHVSGRHVHVGPDVTVQGLHEALAETHNFRLRLSGGVEIAAALAATDG